MRMLSRKVVTILAVLLFELAFVKGAYPQAMSHWSTAELIERAKPLQQQAAEKGNASEILEKYPHHFTMLAFRNRTGGAEVHQNNADVFFILDGRTTLVTGG